MQRIYSWNGTAYIEFPNSIDITSEIADAIAGVEGGAAVWGTVTGVLATQTDLQGALDAKSATSHNHDATYEAKNTNIQGHVISAHAPSNATANSSDATLLARANHTGTQPVGSITGLGTLATQNGTMSGSSSGTNTGDQDLSVKADATLLASYRTLLDSTGSHIAARVAGTYGMAQGQPLAITGTGTLYALNSIYILSTDYPTVNGLAAKLRIRAQLFTNDTPPTGNFTIGLHPITRPGTSGGAGLNIFTIGAAVAGSTLVFTAPAADGLHFNAGADFALPANGHYIIGVVTTATVAASAHVHISASLQIRNA